MVVRIKKGDTVLVVAGRDKGKKGEVMDIFTKLDKASVKGVNVSKCHKKQTQKTEGGIVNKEMPLSLSNLMLEDPKTKKPTKVGIKILKDLKKVRYAKKSGEVIDA